MYQKLVFILILLSASSAKELYVSMGGKDESWCGLIASPCHSLQFAINNRSNTKDTIQILGRYKNKEAIYNATGLVIMKDLHLKGTEGKPVIVSNDFGAMFSVGSSDIRKADLIVTFSNLHFRSVKNKLKNDQQYVETSDKGLVAINVAVLRILGCSFNAVSYPVSYRHDKRKWSHLQIDKCEFVSPRKGIVVSGNGKVRVTLTDSKFRGIRNNSLSGFVWGNFLPLHVTDDLRILIKNSSFSFFVISVYLSTSLTRYGVIEINNCVFKNNMQTHKVSTDYILGGAALSVLNFIHPTEFAHLELFIRDSEFHYNSAPSGGAISIKSVKSVKNRVKAFLQSCKFNGNLALSYGGAFSSDEGCDVRIKNCTFINNVCDAKYGMGYIGDWINGVGGAFAVLPATRFKSIISDVHIINTLFKNNTAIHSGGSIFSAAEHIQLDNVTIVGPTQRKIRPIEGDLITSKYGAKLERVRLVVVDQIGSVLAAKFGEYMEKKPSGGTVYALSVDKKSTFICAEGSNLITSQFLLSRLRGEYTMFNFHCRHCMENSYNTGGSVFRTLTVRHEKCLPCPVGASCFNGTAKASSGFWGFQIQGKRKLKFVRLPLGYGCTKKECIRPDSCAINREGPLCASCKKGYSENFLSAYCSLNSHCNRWLFWVIAFLLVIAYLLFFIKKQELFKILKSQMRFILYFKSLKCFRWKRSEREVPLLAEQGRTEEGCALGMNHVAIGSECNDDLESSDIYIGCEGISQDADDITANTLHVEVVSDACNNDDEEEALESTTNVTEPSSIYISSLVKIVFYFYQASAILKSYGSQELRGKMQILADIVTRIFNFESVTYRGHSMCVFQNLTPLHKIATNVGFRASLFLVLGMLWLFTSQIHRKADIDRGGANTSHKNNFLVVFIEIFLLNYAALTKTIFTLLNCVDIGTNTVLYVQGNIVCYRPWQYAVMVVGFAWIVPFCVFLFLAAKLLQFGYLKGKRIVLCSILPLPALIYYIFIITRKRSTAQRNTRSARSNMTTRIYQVLAGPFKGRFYFWEGVYTLRRLVLISLSTFITEPACKVYSLLVIQVLCLIHHLHAMPFQQKSMNICETISLSALTIICSSKLFSLYSYIGDAEIPKSRLSFLRMLSAVESTMLLLVPCTLIICIVALFFCKIGYFLYNKFQRK